MTGGGTEDTRKDVPVGAVSARSVTNTMGLGGRRVLTLEARLPDILADLITRQGGEAVCVPAVTEVVAPADEVAAPLSTLCRQAVDLVVLQTGVGTTYLHRQASALGQGEAYLDALRRLPIAVRGPKPTAVLHGWGIRPALSAPSPHTTAEVCATLDAVPLAAARVFVQHYGQPNEPLRQYLRGRGAATVDALPYWWGLPQDPAPLREAVQALQQGRFDALVITSMVQVVHLFAVAETLGTTEGLRQALNDRIVVAAVGPVARRAIEGYGVRVTVEPSQPKMAPLVHALAAHFDRVGTSQDA